MTHISDAELFILQQSFAKAKTAFKQNNSSAAQNIMNAITRAEQIISEKMGKDAALLGGSATSKNLFEMFNLTHRLL